MSETLYVLSAIVGIVAAVALVVGTAAALVLIHRLIVWLSPEAVSWRLDNLYDRMEGYRLDHSMGEDKRAAFVDYEHEQITLRSDIEWLRYLWNRWVWERELGINHFLLREHLRRNGVQQRGRTLA